MKKGFRKYFNKKFENEYGKWDSSKEFKQYLKFLEMKERGEVLEVERQVTIPLIPNQYTSEIKHLKTKTKVIQKLAERAIDYRADFVVTYPDGRQEVYDVKSDMTRKLQDYIHKRKLLLYLYGIKLIEL